MDQAEARITLPLLFTAEEATGRGKWHSHGLRAEVLRMASSVRHHFREGLSGFSWSWRRKGSPELLILQFFCSCISSLLPPSPLASQAVSSPS